MNNLTSLKLGTSPRKIHEIALRNAKAINLFSISSGESKASLREKFLKIRYSTYLTIRLLEKRELNFLEEGWMLQLESNDFNEAIYNQVCSELVSELTGLPVVKSTRFCQPENNPYRRIPVKRRISDFLTATKTELLGRLVFLTPISQR